MQTVTIIGQKRKELEDFLSIFEITPTFILNEIACLSSKNTTYQRTTNIKYSHLYELELMHIFISQNSPERVTINKSDNPNTIISVTTEDRKKYCDWHYIHPNIAEIDSESKLTILDKHDKTLDFITYSKGNILFRILVGDTKTLEKIECICPDRLIAPTYFEKQIQNQFGFTIEESGIVLKYILMRIENIYKDFMQTPEKYQGRFNKSIIETINEYKRSIEKLNKRKELVRIRKI